MQPRCPLRVRGDVAFPVRVVRVQRCGIVQLWGADGLLGPSLPLREQEKVYTSNETLASRCVRCASGFFSANGQRCLECEDEFQFKDPLTGECVLPELDNMQAARGA